MSKSGDYVVPGHRDRIGDWPLEKVMSALEDMLYDNANGFLPDSVAEAVEHLSNVLFEREAGAEEAREARKTALSRQLDKWFPATVAAQPQLVGDASSAEERFMSRAAPVYEALQVQLDLASRLAAANDHALAPELDWGSEADLGPER